MAPGLELWAGKIAEGEQRPRSPRPPPPRAAGTPPGESSGAAVTSSPPPVPAAERHRKRAERAGGRASGARRTAGTHEHTMSSRSPSAPTPAPCSLLPAALAEGKVTRAASPLPLAETEDVSSAGADGSNRTN